MGHSTATDRARATEFLPPGFTVGKRAALRDWEIRREIKETRKLVQKYYWRQYKSSAKFKAWYRQWYENGGKIKVLARQALPEYRAKATARAKKWRAKHPEAQREHERKSKARPEAKAKNAETMRQRRAESKAKKAAALLSARETVYSCAGGCGAQWCRAPILGGGAPRRFCGHGRCSQS